MMTGSWSPEPLQRFRALLQAVFYLKIALLSTALAQDADPVQKLVAEAKEFEKQEKHSEALKAFDRAVRLDPTNATVLVERGTFQLKLKRTKEALSDCENAVVVDASNRAAKECKVGALLALGRKQEASQELGSLQSSGSTGAESAVGLEMQAALHLTRAELAQAAEKASQALKLEPNRAGAYAIRAQVGDRMGRFGTAIQDYTKSLELKADDAVLELRATLLAKIGQHEKAIADWTELIRKNPLKSEYLISRAKSLQLMGDRNRANVDFYQAQRLNPSQLGLISKMQNATDAATIQKLSGMLVQAKAPVAPAITEASVSGPANAPAVAEVKRGLLQLGRKGQQASPKSSPPTESAELIAMKAAKAVEQPRAVEQLAAASAEPTKPLVKQANDKPANAKPDGVTKGEPVLTARTLPSVEERTPQPPIDDSDAKLRSKLSEASAFARAGKVKEALAAYSVAIEMRSDFASVYLDRGTLYLKAGSPREAAADFTQAVKLDSRNVKAWMGKCVASVELNLGRDAVLDCNEVLKAEPRNADAVYQRGRAHAQAKNYPEAIRDLRSATELRYDFPEAHLTLGRVYVTINELILGLREFTLAVQKRPGFKDAYRERAEIRRLLGDLLGQQEDLARAGDQRAIPNGSAGLD